MRPADFSYTEGKMTVEEKIKGRKIGVVGMARSGLAAAMLARRYGGEPFVSDSKAADNLTAQTDQLKRRDIPFETGGHSGRLLGADYIIVSPGVPPDADILKRAADKGIPLFSELEFASWVCRGRIIGVTGSNGKTTTTTLLGEIFSTAGFDASVCGNIGLPFSQVADKIEDDGVAVVEVSTFQLERIADFKPHVAMILNLSPDHLDRHGTFETYKKLKYRITENQTADDFLVLNLDDPEIAADKIVSAASRVYFTTKGVTDSGAFVRDGILYGVQDGRETRIINAGEIAIPGPHNLQNAAAAVAAAMLFGIRADVLEKALRVFPGVEHRLERVARVGGIDFVNDSKATNVDSVCCALRSISTPIFLIAGGRDKGGSYLPLLEHGRGRIKGLILIGEAREKMFDVLGRDFPTVFAESLEEAVTKSFELAGSGETVLLSPACASFDMFDDYEHRGAAFKAAVAELKDRRKENETITD
ncbi:MAG: UDP-N-acetylmuramoyl-L-alanine--D-glutamate ligase [candidate division Zixibacteria bacterium]|nr:UDP-N-acetylmuramoyl-L-alanine--D-glutamate ligase [candidate division Zixibacteria bacterium]